MSDKKRPARRGRKTDRQPANGTDEIVENVENDPTVDEAAEASVDIEENGEIEQDAGTPDEAADPDPLAEAELERDQYKDRWLRTVAELDNFRKRSRRETVDARRFAQADVMRDLLEILDNFDRARAALPEDGGSGEAFVGFREGMELIHSRLKEVLASRGLEKIEAGPGTVFDPNLHEAVMQIESEDFGSGEITDVAQPGYRMGELVVRPARVVVAR